VEYKINFVGNEHTNYSDRRGYSPSVIVNHMVQGSVESCINWFTSKYNKQSSAHFLVGKDGSIYQFVKIENNAWANGLKIDQYNRAIAEIVKEKNVNPNYYSVSIEHEGFYEKTKGDLTSKQLKASIWLHKFIIGFVKENFNEEILADREHILGHSEIDPIGKPFCPGEMFPFEEIITELRKSDFNTIYTDIKNHWAEKIIIDLTKKGIVAGYEDKSFKPNNFVTRAEIAAICDRIIKYIKI
jgi:N-acetyl-anhydromuramyl-L-alanine amidase AmpD